MNIYGRFCCVLVVPILLLRCVVLPFVCVLSCALLRPFLVDLEMSTFAVFLRHFLEDTVEDLFLERVYCTFCCCHVFFLFQALADCLFYSPFVVFCSRVGVFANSSWAMTAICASENNVNLLPMPGLP